MRTSTGRCDVEGIHRFVAEQFDVASQIITGGLCPIIEIEVVHSPYKSAAGDMLGAAITQPSIDSTVSNWSCWSLIESLTINQSDDELQATLRHSIGAIYRVSVNCVTITGCCRGPMGPNLTGCVRPFMTHWFLAL